MSRSDEEWMTMAVDLARHRVGLTGENPAVGCILVSAGELIAASVTGEGGRPHAEEQALSAAGSRAAGATAYVTLEPCGARSSGAPSCAQRLIEARVARVVVACRDSSAYASGQGAEQLQAAGVPVDLGVMADEAAELYDDYPFLG
jgi:diaminohydroxyphosphoribosylaminopyrimidine deaminase/5-amino-6-(5-phosphoribosylamino)uracil reductase